MAGSDNASWPKGIGAITLFVEDLTAAKQFYREVFGLSVTFEDDDAAVFDFGNTIVNLLKTTAARELIEPAAVAPRGAGSRLQITIGVEDVDAMCAELAARGVKLLNGPIDRSWGVRTASFSDPGGHIWEIAKEPAIAMMRAGPDSGSALHVVIAGRVTGTDGATLCERVRVLLVGSDTRLVVCDVADLSDADIATIDALARLQLTARRLGISIEVRGATSELRELLALAGLEAVVRCSEALAVEPRGEAEQRKEPRRVEEEADPGDPIA